MLPYVTSHMISWHDYLLSTACWFPPFCSNSLLINQQGMQRIRVTVYFTVVYFRVQGAAFCFQTPRILSTIKSLQMFSNDRSNFKYRDRIETEAWPPQCHCSSVGNEDPLIKALLLAMKNPTGYWILPFRLYQLNVFKCEKFTLPSVWLISLKQEDSSLFQPTGLFVAHFRQQSHISATRSLIPLVTLQIHLFRRSKNWARKVIRTAWYWYLKLQKLFDFQ